MSSTAAEPPPGEPPGGQAGDPNTGPQTSASSSQQGPHSEHCEGEDVGGDDTCGRLDLRPPVPGEEDLQRSHQVQQGEWNKDPLAASQPPYSDWGKGPPGPHLPHSVDWGKEPPGDWHPKPFNPHAGTHLCSHYQGDGGGDFPAILGGSVEGGSPCFGGGEGGTTPPAVRWSESLLQLLEDPHGVQLFQEFLKEECGSCESLQFWFACNGLRKSDKQDPSQLVTIIWKRYIRNFVVRVSEKTYKMVNDRINARSIDRSIFDDAQQEVEEEMARSTYPSFLKSERYLTYLAAATQQTGGDSPHSPSPCSPGAGVVGGSGVLPTLHEDCEYQGSIGNTQLRLTQVALAATVKQRAAAERRKPEAFAGQYLHGVSNCGGGSGVNPYHALYSTAHVSSRQDSELQSLSSDALTDDTLSCTDSSVDGMSVGLGGSINPKHLKRQYYKMRENARQNRELALSAATGGGFSGSQSGGILHGGVPFMPRTHRLRHESIPSTKPSEFAALLIEKLEKVKRDRESQEKVQQSFKKIQEGDNVSDECRREHAFNSLPPSLLLDKLAQKISLDDADPCQSILDEHVSRVWQDSNNDTPARSPGSPRPKSPSGRRSGSLQPSRPTVLSHHGIKGNVMVGVGHPSMYVSGTNYLPPTQAPHPLHVPASHRAHCPPGHPAHLPPGHMPNPYQANRSWHHPRRRERGQDVYSTFSSDSGNVADYNESTDRSSHLPLPKSRSMPEYMENYAGTSSDGGSSGRRQQSSRRSSSRRAPADLTDSGVSVVSDSGPSLTPSASSTERRSSSGGGRRSVSGGSVGGVVGLSASSMSGSGSLGGSGSLVSGRPGSVERSGNVWMPALNIDQRELIGIHPGLMMHPHATHQSHSSHSSHSAHDDSKKRSRGGGGGCHGSSRCASHNSGHSSGHNWSHSEGSSGRGSCHGDATTPSATNPSGPGSNGSTLRKQRPSRHSQPTPPGAVCESGGSSSGGSGGSVSGIGGGGATSSVSGTGSTGASASECTTVVYNFHDDSVPFVIRVPTRPVTLKRFKQHLPKKGNYRFFFKKHCEEFGVIQEEITDDSEIIPLFEGKINAQIRKAD
ncbi:axin-2-like isoform X2 [Macrobrachium nipponense]|uniref:axin-2-like isoform X2 n=1 Tax=Macrobrachium nipponense TaxID=159736 RepID=UPI0030C80EC4